MNPRSGDSDQTQWVDKVLESSTDGVAQVGTRQWQVPSKNGRSVTATVQLTETWLLFDAPLTWMLNGDKLDSRLIGDLFSQNGSLPGRLKFVVPPHSMAPAVAADLPMDEEGDGQGEIAATCGELHELLKRQHGRRPAGRGKKKTARRAPAKAANVADSPLTQTGDQVPAEGVAQLCAETGWTCTQRSDGQPAITLDVTGAFHQALAASTPDGSVRLAVALDVADSLPPVCRTAVQLFLLTASRVIRMVRATGSIDPSLPAYRWEVAWSETPSAFQFHHGLSALSVACRHTAREVEALGDEEIAKQYLWRRGPVLVI